MKKLLLALLLPLHALAQPVLRTGAFAEMNIAYDEKTNNITGYYENDVGYNDELKMPRFFCDFYFMGKLEGSHARLYTSYDSRRRGDVMGELEVIAPNKVSFIMKNDESSCWESFILMEKASTFNLDEATSWVEIRYAVKDRVYFHSEPGNGARMKQYIVTGDIVYIDKIDNDWALCSYIGQKKVTRGWIKLGDLNRLD